MGKINQRPSAQRTTLMAMIVLDDDSTQEANASGRDSVSPLTPALESPARKSTFPSPPESRPQPAPSRGLAWRLFKLWRAGATGLAFATFMAGCLFLVFGPFQILRLRRMPALERHLKVLRLIHGTFGQFMRFLAWLRVMKPLIIEGREHLHLGKPCLYVANHPTLLDVVALISLLPAANCIVKKSLWDHFFIGGVVKAAGFIPNDHAQQLMEDCEHNFTLGKSLIIFPEGTRSPAHALRPFNRGAAQIALRTGVALQPVVVTCEPPTLMKGQAWYDVPDEPFQIKLTIGPALAVPEEIAALNDPPRQARELTRRMKRHFEVAIFAAKPD